jgi:predicted phosphodiesterase
VKIGIISDRHPLHWKRFSEAHFDSIVASVEIEKPDVLIDAGDWEDTFLADMIGNSIPCEFYRAWGNHDYYGDKAPGLQDGCQHIEYQGVKFTIATLWGDLNKLDPMTELSVKNYLNDFNLIQGMSGLYYASLFKAHRQYILDNPADVVVTHHLPTFKSIHEAYKTEANRFNNWGFASHMDDVIDTIKPKLWVHGHTHVLLDYMIEGTRVVCNPLGYPNERFKLDGRYEPLYVEI